MHRLLLACVLGLAATAPAVADDQMPPPPPPDCGTEMRVTDGFCPPPPPPPCGMEMRITEGEPECVPPPPPPTCEPESRAVAAPTKCMGPPMGPGPAGGPPDMKGGFLNRVWRMDSDVDAFDEEADVLNVTITKMLNIPKRFADQDDEIIDSDAYVLFSKTTRVYDADRRRVFRETRYDGLLDVADTARIVGKVVPPHKWELDEDGFPTPTLRAKRVYVTG